MTCFGLLSQTECKYEQNSKKATLKYIASLGLSEQLRWNETEQRVEFKTRFHHLASFQIKGCKNKVTTLSIKFEAIKGFKYENSMILYKLMEVSQKLKIDDFVQILALKKYELTSKNSDKTIYSISAENETTTYSDIEIRRVLNNSWISISKTEN